MFFVSLLEFKLVLVPILQHAIFAPWQNLGCSVVQAEELPPSMRQIGKDICNL